MEISGVKVGGDEPCRFVAEISNNHNGSPHLALELISAAKMAGADFVKFQCYTPDELVALRGNGPAPEPWGSEGWTLRELYERAQTPHAWFGMLVWHCNAIGLPWFSSAFGSQSLKLLAELGCPVIKLASIDLQYEGWRSYAYGQGKPVIQSIPHEDPTDFAFAHEPAATLYCPPGYPQDVSLHKLRTAMESDHLGFSYHGTDPKVPAAAAHLGAKLVECHMQLDRITSELESEVSLTASQFGHIVEMVREAEA